MEVVDGNWMEDTFAELDMLENELVVASGGSPVGRNGSPSPCGGEQGALRESMLPRTKEEAGRVRSTLRTQSTKANVSARWWDGRLQQRCGRLRGERGRKP